MLVHARRFLHFAALALAAVAPWPAAQAAPADYPTRPIQLVVPYPAGGGSDSLARIVAHRLDAELGQPVVVDNRPGASTNIAAGMVARAPADGYTILLGTTNTFVTNAFFYPSLPYDPVKDFAVLGMPARLPFFLVASKQSGIKSVAELVARAKSEPGKMNYGSPGAGTPHHLIMELFKQQADIDIAHIPFKGVSQVLQDLLPGRVDTMFLDYAGGAALLKDGTKLTVLGTADTTRSSLMPDVPSIAEAGYKSFSVYGWQGFAVRRDTPPAIVAKLRKAVDAAINDPKVQAQLKEAGFDPAPMSAPQFATFIEQERTKLTALVKSRGLASRP
mgnify:CR=1 FL=1